MPLFDVDLPQDQRASAESVLRRSADAERESNPRAEPGRPMRQRSQPVAAMRVLNLLKSIFE